MIQPARAQTRPAEVPDPPVLKRLVLELGDNTSLTLVQIPAGKFQMGSPAEEKDRDPSEVQHAVSITKPFYMATTPITVAQFSVFAKLSGYRTGAETQPRSVSNFDYVLEDGKLALRDVPGRSWRNTGFAQKPDHPVVNISWYDCHAFCDWLTARTGRPIRLPSEAQFEYAARAGSTTTYPWGDNLDDGKSLANLADASQKKLQPNALPLARFGAWDDGFAYTSPVQTYKPNKFGLYDMTGNVWQWCEDKFADYSPGPASDPLITGIRGTRWVMRGGSFLRSPSTARSAARLGPNPGKHFFDYGFRVIVADEKN